ncbi:MAG: GNAT family N-acetyltransferase [Coriobacteriia bacterium]|nr:GNAT family N-acetyltransferase [Coriobacteriia bacterium]
MLHADRDLAARIEALAAAEMRRFVAAANSLDSACGAVALELAGGVAAYVGAGSPVNQAFGLGFAGPVSLHDVIAVERFFVSRAAQPYVGLSPLAHPTAAACFSERGWVIDGFENVLVRTVTAEDAQARPPASIEIREVDDAEGRDTWAYAAATGFSYPLPPLAAQLELGRIVAARRGTRLLLALVDGEVAGTGELYVEDGVAWLSGDATMPAYRRRGVQQALQSARLALGAEAGCDLAVTESAPGSPSQRNMERIGFRVAYTRVNLVAPHENGQAETHDEDGGVA